MEKEEDPTFWEMFFAKGVIMIITISFIVGAIHSAVSDSMRVAQPYIWCKDYTTEVVGRIPVGCFKNGVFDSKKVIYVEPKFK